MNLHTIFKDLLYIGLWILKLFRNPINIYIVVYKDKIKIISLDTDKEIISNKNVTFSSSRMLIATPLTIEKLGNELFKKLYPSIDIKTRKIKILCQPIDEILSELSQSEKMIFEDFLMQIGGNQTRIISDKNELSLTQAKTRINKEFNR